MKDQHTKITGYRDLTEAEIKAMNDIKALGLKIDVALTEVRFIPHVDVKWLESAKLDLQVGIMKAVRAVARPETF